MSRVSYWCALWTALLVFAGVGCGSGFQAKIRPASEFSQGSNGVCCAGFPPVSSPRSNLIDNAGFESAATAWEDWGASQITAAGAHSGGAGLRVTGVGGRAQEVIYRLKAGATYQMKVFARSASINDSVYVGVRFFDTGNATMGDERVRVNTQAFSEYSVRFRLPLSVSSAKIYLYKEAGGSAAADADDFTLSMVEAPVNPPMEPAVSNPNNFQPSGPGSGWTLVLNEDFNSSLNPSVWNTGFWFNYTINNELQAYRSENVRVGTGTMSLLAEARATTTAWGDPMNYASGAVTTRNKFTFTFGVAEARIRVPRGRGLYPQFWMLPNNKRSPPEIDILQVLGHDTSTARFNYLWMDDNGIPHAQPMTAKADFAGSYHTFTVQWLPDSITYYIDGVVAGTYRGDFVLRDPAYLILNLAVGGSTAGSPDGSTQFPQSMDVEYVRVWQKPL